MLHGGQERVFPVIFFDGEREFPIGHVKIMAKKVYRTFLHVVSQYIHVSPTQISIFLVDRKNLRKTFISAKTNFAHVCREQHCFLLVTLKKSWTRKASNGELVVPERRILYPQSCVFVPQNVTLLLPPHHHLQVDMNYNLQFHDQIAQQYLNPYGVVSYNHNEGFHRIQKGYPKMIMDKPTLNYCEECRIAKKNGEVADFHHCVNDEVVKGLRPCPFGPIGPSLK